MVCDVGLPLSLKKLQAMHWRLVLPMNHGPINHTEHSVGMYTTHQHTAQHSTAYSPDAKQPLLGEACNSVIMMFFYRLITFKLS